MNFSRPATFAATTLAAGLFLLPAARVNAQQNAAATPSVSAAPGGERPEGGDRREEFRQRMTERLKTQLKVSDDEWTVIQPLLEKTVEKMAASRGPGGFGPGGFGPGGNREFRRQGGNNGGGNNQNAGGNQPQPADNNNQGGGNNRENRRGGFGGPRGGSPEAQALQATLADDNSTVNDVKAKLEALRAQRKQAAAELAQAREELRKVLNMRQEAALVMDGILD